MQIKISARHGHLNKAHQLQIQEKAEKLLHFFDRISLITITVDLQDKLFKEVEFIVDAEHKHTFVAKERNDELLACVDHVIDKIKLQINRHKEKLQDHRRDPSHNGGPATS